MDKYAFISDVHLGGFDDKMNRQIKESFFSLIDYCIEENYTIVFVGDIFDYWLEYDDGTFPHEFEDVLTKIKDIILIQSELLMITGNHDNWTLGKFNELGCTVFQDFIDLKTNSQNYLLFHGDGLLRNNYTDDSPTRSLLNSILRSKLFISFYRAMLPKKMGIEIMKRFSSWNRKRRPTQLECQSVLNNWFENFDHKHKFNTIICGHDHIPRIIRHEQAKYINLGSFYDNQTFATLVNNETKLVKWDSKNNSIIDFNQPDE